MKTKELKRLSRGDLLEMLLELSQENDRLNKELTELREKLNRRSIDVAESGSIAEAALKLNDVFQAAQAACDQYTDNIRAREALAEERCRRIEAKARSEAEVILDKARQRGNAIVEEARGQAQKLLENEKAKLDAMGEDQRWLLNIFSGGESE